MMNVSPIVKDQPADNSGVVSVLVPLYNHEFTVDRALSSILSSDCSKIELLISDDASQDNSHAKAALWLNSNGHRFLQAKIYRQSRNLGITGNLNYLVAQARGEFITLLASDDELTPHSIDTQKAYLERNPDKDFVFGNMSAIDTKSRILQDRLVSKRRAGLLKKTAWGIIDIVYNWGPPWPRLFARREAFLAIGEYKVEHSFEDRWSALQIAKTRRFGYIDEIVHQYRVRGEGTATAGLDPARISRDMRDVEQGAVAESQGLLRFLLLTRVKSFKECNKREVSRLLWLTVRAILHVLYKLWSGELKGKAF